METQGSLPHSQIHNIYTNLSLNVNMPILLPIYTYWLYPMQDKCLWITSTFNALHFLTEQPSHFGLRLQFKKITPDGRDSRPYKAATRYLCLGRNYSIVRCR